jgi:hypothetical protein
MRLVERVVAYPIGGASRPPLPPPPPPPPPPPVPTRRELAEDAQRLVRAMLQNNTGTRVAGPSRRGGSPPLLERAPRFEGHPDAQRKW